jgi:hypothetical protein
MYNSIDTIIPQIREIIQLITETRVCSIKEDKPTAKTELNADKIIHGILKYFK